MGGTPPPFAENSTQIINFILEPFPYLISEQPNITQSKLCIENERKDILI